MIPDFLRQIFGEVAGQGGVYVQQRIVGQGGGSFERHIRRLDSEVEMRIAHLDGKDQTAVLELGGDASGYAVVIGAMPDGRTLLQLTSHSSWPGQPPQAAHVAASRMDATSRTVSFKAKRCSGGRSKVVATAVVGPIRNLTADQFIAVSGEMAYMMRVADRAFEEHGLV